MMKNHGLRRFFSLLLAVFMVCTLLPTAALAEDTAGDDETPPKTVAVDEKKTELPAQEQPKGENPPAPKQEADVVPETMEKKTVVEVENVNNRVATQPMGKENAPAQPTPLNEADVKALLGDSAVKVHCSTPNSGHSAVTYSLLDDSFTVGDVQGNPGNYTCDVTVRADQYVAAYSNGHTLASANESPKTITLKHDGIKWTVPSTIPIIFNVACVTEIVPPHKPTDEELANLETAVEVTCTTKPETHAAAHFSLRAGTYTIGNVVGNETDGYTCDITVTADRYVAWYNLDYGKHTLTGDKTKTLTLKYEEGQWAVDTPVTFTVICPPTKPGAKDLAKLETAVEVACTTKPEMHATAQFSLRNVTCTIGDVVGNETDGYTCDITVTADVYVGLYNMDYGKHTLLGDNTKTLTLKYVEGQWAVDTPVTFTVICPPTKPGAKDLAKLETAVEVACTTKPETHAAAHFSLRAGTYTIGNVAGNETDGYTCDITVTPDDIYVWLYNLDYGKHTLTGDNTEKTLKLKYEEGQWAVDTPVTFNVTCVAQPTFDQLKEIFNQKISVKCNTKLAHTETPYDLIADSYTIEDFSTMTDLPTCTVVLHSREYVKLFNGTTKPVHTPEDEVMRVRLVLRGGSWVVATDDELPVVFQVVCVPDAPTERYLEDLLNREVTVTCTTNAAHAPAEYGLLDGSYQGSGVQPDGNGRYTYTVTIAAAEYVKKYNTERPKNHSLVKDEPTEKSVTLVWNANDHKWGFADANAVPVNFNVKCLYTVTYKDGADGSVFKTVSFPDLKKGEATPTIDDPIRVGYKFAGWEPTVAATVTKDVTYIAQWEKVDTTFTVKYNDNVKGKAFKEQVHENLKYNEETPKFDGTPKRTGYTFTGWKPVVADNVTENVTYVAQWKSNSGKDNVPKTGDGEIVMILSSVLLFSFCGAAAVCVCDRKRKQG